MQKQKTPYRVAHAGYNIPMTINPRNFAAGLPYACTSPTCTLDPATCPPETILQVRLAQA